MSYPQGPAVRMSQVPATPGVRRVIPAPYQRPSISIGTAPEARRHWRLVRVIDLGVGDTVADFGRLTAVDEHLSSMDDALARGLPPAEVVENLRWSVTVTGTDVGQGAPVRTYAGVSTVYAHTRAEDAEAS